MKYMIYTDGGARGNPGPAATGVVINYNGESLSLSTYLGTTTNNVAEYSAVLQAIHYLVEQQLEPGETLFFLDSELVVKQLTGVYKIKDHHLQHLAREVFTALNKWGGQVTFTHIPREKNRAADALVNKTLDSIKKPS